MLCDTSAAILGFIPGPIQTRAEPLLTRYFPGTSKWHASSREGRNQRKAEHNGVALPLKVCFTCSRCVTLLGGGGVGVLCTRADLWFRRHDCHNPLPDPTLAPKMLCQQAVEVFRAENKLRFEMVQPNWRTGLVVAVSKFKLSVRSWE